MKLCTWGLGREVYGLLVWLIIIVNFKMCSWWEGMDREDADMTPRITAHGMQGGDMASFRLESVGGRYLPMSLLKLNCWSQTWLGRVGYNPSQPSSWSCRWWMLDMLENIDPRGSDEEVVFDVEFFLLSKWRLRLIRNWVGVWPCGFSMVGDDDDFSNFFNLKFIHFHLSCANCWKLLWFCWLLKCSCWPSQKDQH